MKKFFFVLIPTLFFAMNSTFAANVDAVFDGTDGTLTLPHLIVDGEVYYVTLSLIDAESLTFRVNLESAVVITPTEATSGTLESELWGTWTASGVSVEDLVLVFNSDGTYTHFENIGDCSGDEAGTYSWEPSTGVFIPHVTLDTNGDCGLSHPRGSDLFFIEGNALTIQETGAGGETFTFLRAPDY